MLFDAFINLFKTICLAAVAFSPLLVYKALEKPAEQNCIITVPLEVMDLNSGSTSKAKYEDAIFPNNAPTQNTSLAFGNNTLFAGSFAPPPPPPPPVDAPLDSEIYLLLVFGIAYGSFRYGLVSKALMKKN